MKQENKLNFNINDTKKKNHMHSIPNYLEITNNLIKKRTSKGYIRINIFYIIGISISLITIAYLLITK